MTNQFDVLALSEKIARESKSGKISCDLLAQGQTLYGNSLDFPDYLKRITPDGKNSLGHWRSGEFEQVISLL